MWILLCMILIMPFEKSPYLKLSSSFLGIFPEFTMIKLLGLGGLVWVVWQVAGGRLRLGLFDSAQGRLFFVFFGWVVLAGLVKGTGLTALTRYLSLVLFFPIILAAVQGERNIKQILWASVAIMVLIFPYAYRQYMRFGGRLGVGLNEPNYFALALVLLVPLAIVIARQQEETGKRALWFLGSGVLVMSLILTGSRGGFLGGLIAIGLLACKIARRPCLAAGLTILALLMVVVIFPTTLGQRLFASFQGAEVQDIGVAKSTEAHADLLTAGLRMMHANPVFGVGLGKFKEQSSVYYEVATNRIAHNTYVQIAAESGLPALLIFLLLVRCILRSLSRSARLASAQARPHLGAWASAMQAGLTGYLVSACFLSAQFEKFFWVMVFLSITLERHLHTAAVVREAEPTVEPAWRKWAVSSSQNGQPAYGKGVSAVRDV